MDYREIINRIGTLAGKDHGVTPSILSRWYKTGYKECLQKTTHLEDTIAQSDAALTRLARLKRLDKRPPASEPPKTSLIPST